MILFIRLIGDFRMDYTPELTKALEELKKLTGLTFQIQASTLEEQTYAFDQIHHLTLAYKEKYNKNHFLKNLLSGQIRSSDLHEQSKHFHIANEAARILYLVECKTPIDDTIFQILRQLFPVPSHCDLVPMNEYTFAMIQQESPSFSKEEALSTAHMIVDTLNTEALTSVHISYSKLCHSLSELAQAYQDTSLALKVGCIFYSEHTIFPSDHLGIGRLIYDLPTDICKDFLSEIFGKQVPHSFDDETMQTVNKFFQNNLNIAETSRQLHMHRNTLIYRLEQIEKHTGLDLRKFEDAMTFKIAIMTINYLQTERSL